jgi:hypothetical protein
VETCDAPVRSRVEVEIAAPRSDLTRADSTR